MYEVTKVKGKALGYLLGAIAAASYGLNPDSVLLFDEGMTVREAFGMAMILVAVSFVVAGASKGSTITKHLTRFRHMFPKLK